MNLFIVISIHFIYIILLYGFIYRIVILLLKYKANINIYDNNYGSIICLFKLNKHFNILNLVALSFFL